MDWLFHTENSFSYVVLRAGLAVTFFMHGTQHAFGWHGGKGPKAQVTNWRDKYHIPIAMGVFALVIELSTVVSMTLGSGQAGSVLLGGLYCLRAVFEPLEQRFLPRSRTRQGQRYRIYSGALPDGFGFGDRRRRRVIDRWLAGQVMGRRGFRIKRHIGKFEEDIMKAIGKVILAIVFLGAVGWTSTASAQAVLL